MSRLDNHLTIETKIIKDIPVMACIPESEQACPLVFYIPGYTGKRSDGLSLAYQLGQVGIACVGIDPMFHGSRYDARLLDAAKPEYGGAYPAESGLDVFVLFMQVIEQSARDIQSLLDALSDDTRLNINRSGVTGISMGACATFLAFATIPQLKAAVPMMGIPTFTRRWLDLLDECVWSNPEWKAALSRLGGKIEADTVYIESIDPASSLHHAVPRALLMMNGDFDTDMMKTFTLSWYRDHQAAWDTYADHLQWNVYPVGHTVTPQMEEDATKWFEWHL